MSVETIAVVISAATLLLSFFGSFAWMISRVDRQFEGVGERITGVERELVEVKIAIARFEGPPRRLVPTR